MMMVSVMGMIEGDFDVFGVCLVSHLGRDYGDGEFEGLQQLGFWVGLVRLGGVRRSDSSRERREMDLESLEN